MAKARPQRGATRQSPRRVPAWLLLGAGFAGGCFFSFLVYLSSVDSKPAPVAAAAPAKEKPAAAPATSATKFDFFTLLPEREVIVPEEQSTSANASGSAGSSAQPAEPVHYILQAGSFRRAGDADRRRAELILLGMEAKVEAVEANGDTWHRVYVGPFNSSGKVSRARATLITQGIDTLLLKRKG